MFPAEYLALPVAVVFLMSVLAEAALKPDGCMCPVGCLCQNSCSYARCADKTLNRLPVGFDASRLTVLWVVNTQLAGLTSASGLLRLKGLRSLRIKKNQLREVKAGSLRLPHLRQLNLYDARLQHLRPGFMEGLPALEILSITASNIDLPSEDICGSPLLNDISFANMKLDRVHECFSRLNATQISLDGMQFPGDKLTRELLFHLPKKKIGMLKIMNCRITSMDDDTFQGFALKYIRIDGNRIKHITTKVLNTMTNLGNLGFRQNGMVYFGIEMIDNMKHLYKLDLSLNRITSISFNRTISRLELLNLRENKLTHITNTTFQHLPYLLELYLDSCRISQIHENSFKHLHRLTTLSIYINPVEINGVIEALVDLQTYNKLTDLRIGSDALSHLDNKTFSSLQQTLSIISLDVHFRKITHIGNGTFRNFPDLSKLVFFGQKLEAFDEQSLEGLGKLQTFYLENLQMTSMYIARYLFGNTVNSLKVLQLYNNNINDIVEDLRGYNYLEVLSLKKNNIVKLRMNIFNEAQNLKVLDISFNSISKVIHSSLSKPPVLEKLFMMFNKLQQIEHINVFENFHNLKTLTLGSNIKLCKNKDLCYHLFRNLPSLQDLDIKTTGITILHKDMFKGSDNITTLYMDNNDIRQLIVFDNMKNLETLFLNRNNLVGVDVVSLYSLPKLTSLSMLHNPFACNCDLRRFLDFVRSNDIFIGMLENNYKCASPLVDKDKSILDMSSSQYDCADNTSVETWLGITSCFCALLTLSTIAYRLRWQLRYYAFLLGSRLSAKTRQYTYKAFVAHSKDDNRWIMEQLLPNVESESVNLCLHGRDWLAGKLISDNIVESIETSEKILLIVSNGFLRSKWCSFETSLAESVCSERLLVVLLEPLQMAAVPGHLLRLLSSKTYLQWDPTPDNANKFWKALRQALKTPTTDLRIMDQ